MDRRFAGQDRHPDGEQPRDRLRASQSASSPRARASSSPRATRMPWTRRSTRLGGAEHALGVAGKADDPEHQAATVRAGHRGVRLGGPARQQRRHQHRDAAPDGDRPRRRPQDHRRQRARARCSGRSLVHDAWMREHGGAILNVSSIGAVQVAPGLGFYGVSKAMLAHLTASARGRARARASGSTRSAPPSSRPSSRPRSTRVARPRSPRRTRSSGSASRPTSRSAAAFLLSEDAGWITGQHLARRRRHHAGRSPCRPTKVTPELTAPPH